MQYRENILIAEIPLIIIFLLKKENVVIFRASILNFISVKEFYFYFFVILKIKN